MFGEYTMIQLTDIHSLSDFQRHAKVHLKQMQKTGRPEVLTINGKAELIVQDAYSYQQLLDAVERLEVIAGIKSGLASMKRGKGQPAENVLERFRQKHKISSSV